MCEMGDPQDSKNGSKAESDEYINPAYGNTVYDLLNDFDHFRILCTGLRAIFRSGIFQGNCAAATAAQFRNCQSSVLRNSE